MKESIHLGNLRDRLFKSKSALLCIGLCLLWILILPHAGFLVPVLHIVGFAGAAIPVLILGALLFTFRPQWRAAILGLILAWFSLVFLEAWSVGLDNACTAKILIPIGDSAGYYFDAGRIAHGSQLSQWAAAHVLSHSFFGALSLLTGQNLLLTHCVAALLAALSLCLCSEQVNASMGRLSAALFLTVCGIMFMGILGTFASELYGLSAGLLATALMLAGVRKENVPLQMGGLFALGIALVARPGAFFALPLIGVAFATMQPTWRRRGIVLGFAVLVVAASLAFNAGVTKLLCEPATTAMGTDFWHHFNGMLMGKGWSASIATCTADEARAASIRAVSENPWMLLHVSWKAIRFFFENHIAFAYLPWRGARIAEWILAAGALCCLIRIRRPLERLLFASFAGLLLSLPFAPPWDAGVRTYAATMPLQVLTGLGIVCVLEKAATGLLLLRYECILKDSLKDLNPGTKATTGIFATLIAIGVVLPLIALNTPLHYGARESGFSNGRMNVRFIPGTCLRITPDDALAHSFVPRIRHSDFVRPMHGFHYTFMADDTAVYSRIPEGVVLTRGDAVGLLFVVKDDFGKTLPDHFETDATLVHLRGDNVVYDKRLGMDTDQVARMLDSVYMPWLEGYNYYYRYQPVLGEVAIEDIADDGTVRLRTAGFGVLSTSKARFPLFTRVSDGVTLRMDVEAGTMSEVK